MSRRAGFWPAWVLDDVALVALLLGERLTHVAADRDSTEAYRRRVDEVVGELSSEWLDKRGAIVHSPDPMSETHTDFDVEREHRSLEQQSVARTTQMPTTRQSRDPMPETRGPRVADCIDELDSQLGRLEAGLSNLEARLSNVLEPDHSLHAAGVIGDDVPPYAQHVIDLQSRIHRLSALCSWLETTAGRLAL